MAEWLVEDGIDEARALLVDDGRVLAGKLYWPGEYWRGQIAMAQLVSKPGGSRRGTARLEDGAQILVDKLPPQLTEGERFAVRISRAAIAERGRLKRAQGRYHGESVPLDAPASPFESLEARTVAAFDQGLWEEVWSAASASALDFTGGGIVLSPTPAMTVIDVDCSAPDDAYRGAIPAIATALRWFDIGGNIGIDFPTIADRNERKAFDQRLATHLLDWPHESTAMNGFGFVQLVAGLGGPSMLHRFATSRVGMCARFALRLAERAGGVGPVVLLRVHPALAAKLKGRWIEELARRTGKQVRIETDPALALEAPSAQILAE